MLTGNFADTEHLWSVCRDPKREAELLAQVQVLQDEWHIKYQALKEAGADEQMQSDLLTYSSLAINRLIRERDDLGRRVMIDRAIQFVIDNLYGGARCKLLELTTYQKLCAEWFTHMREADDLADGLRIYTKDAIDFAVRFRYGSLLLGMLGHGDTPENKAWPAPATLEKIKGVLEYVRSKVYADALSGRDKAYITALNTVEECLNDGLRILEYMLAIDQREARNGTQSTA